MSEFLAELKAFTAKHRAKWRAEGPRPCNPLAVDADDYAVTLAEILADDREREDMRRADFV